MEIHIQKAPLKRLHFDIENRPLSYWFDGQCTAEITAIAGSFAGSDEMHCELLYPAGDLENHMLNLQDVVSMFVELYDKADIVTGHYIRKHDLPLINGACMELGMPPLKPKLTVDTKLDLGRTRGLSMSQEALSAMESLDNAKHHMHQTAWRTANRLVVEGFEGTRRRVTSDVLQHKELYQVLVPYLKKGKIWSP
jgi:hypothetical protein